MSPVPSPGGGHVAGRPHALALSPSTTPNTYRPTQEAFLPFPPMQAALAANPHSLIRIHSEGPLSAGSVRVQRQTAGGRGCAMP